MEDCQDLGGKLIYIKRKGGERPSIISTNCISQNSDANELVDIEREITAAAYPAVFFSNDNVIPH